jgi:DNA-binding CsgD family transcriptional regulator
MREATVRIPDSSLAAVGLDGLVSTLREAGLRRVTELACGGDAGLLLVRTAEPAEGLGDLASIDRIQRLDGGNDGDVRYLLAAAAGGLAATTRHRPVACDPSVAPDGLTLSLVGPQRTLAGRLAAYEAAGMEAELRRTVPYGGSGGPLAALTPRQREVLRTAHRLGYFAVPREASTAEVAAALGLDDSTVAEHLQRAERNLLDRLLG